MRNLVKLLYHKKKAEQRREEIPVKFQKLVSENNILLKIQYFSEELDDEEFT